MADPVTDFLGLDLIPVGGSNNTWGTKLNDNAELIDAGVEAAQDAADAAQTAADAAQATADEALAGNASLTAITATPTGGDPFALSIDLDLGSLFYIPITSAFVTSDFIITFLNRPTASAHRRVTLWFDRDSTGGSTSNLGINVVGTQREWALPMGVAVADGSSNSAFNYLFSNGVVSQLTKSRQLVVDVFIVADV